MHIFFGERHVSCTLRAEIAYCLLADPLKYRTTPNPVSTEVTGETATELYISLLPFDTTLLDTLFDQLSNVYPLLFVASSAGFS